jgi:hypothetical protein
MVAGFKTSSRRGAPPAAFRTDLVRFRFGEKRKKRRSCAPNLPHEAVRGNSNSISELESVFLLFCARHLFVEYHPSRSNRAFEQIFGAKQQVPHVSGCDKGAPGQVCPRHNVGAAVSKPVGIAKP